VKKKTAPIEIPRNKCVKNIPRKAGVIAKIKEVLTNLKSYNWCLFKTLPLGI